MTVGVLLCLLGSFIDRVQFYRQFHNVATVCATIWGSFSWYLKKQSKILNIVNVQHKIPQSKLKATCSVALNYFGHRNIVKLACTRAFLKQLHLRNYT